MDLANDSTSSAAHAPLTASSPSVHGREPVSSSGASLPPLGAQIADLERRLGVATNIREGAATLLNVIQPDASALRDQVVQELANSKIHINSLKADIALLQRQAAGEVGSISRSLPLSDLDFGSDLEGPAFGPGGWGMGNPPPFSPTRSDFVGPADGSPDRGSNEALVEPKGQCLLRSRSSPQLSTTFDHNRRFPFDDESKSCTQQNTIVTSSAGDTFQHAPHLSSSARPPLGSRDSTNKLPPSTALSSLDASETTRLTAHPQLGKLSKMLTELQLLGVSTSTAFNRARILTQMTDLLHEHPSLCHTIPISHFVSVVTAQLSEGSGKGARARAYRALRRCLAPPIADFSKAANHHGLHWYLVQTFLREAPCLEEREQALMLVRAMVSTFRISLEPQFAPVGRSLSLETVVDMSVIRGLVAISYDVQDRLHLLCVETLAEISLVNPEYFIRAGALHAVVTAIADLDLDVAPALMRTILSLLDMPSSRTLINPGIDLEPVLAAFTDPRTHLAEDGSTTPLKKHASIIATMLRSWTGLMYLCLRDHFEIRSLVTAIHVYPESSGNILLDELLALTEMTSVSSQRIAKSSTTSKKNTTPTASKDDPMSPNSLPDHFVALLLNIFLEAGLVDALVKIIETSAPVRSKATLVLSEVLRLCNLLLPSHVGQKASTLPRLFSLGSSMSPEQASSRDIASDTLATLDKLSRDATPGHARSIVQTLAAKRQAPADGRRVDKLQQQALANVDDATFRSMLADSQVNNARDPNKWNVEILIDLLDGVLVMPRRFDEVLRQGRFVRRLCSFYHPMARRFSTLAKTRASRVWARLGTQLMHLLMKHPDGLEFLTDDPLLAQIGECLAQLDSGPHSASNTIEEPLFSRAKLGTTVVEGYFEMLGVISTTKGGLALLERSRIFTLLHRFIAAPSRDYIVRTALQHLSFNVEGHARVLLGHALTAGTRATRLFATSKLAQTLQSMPGRDNLWNTSTASWMVELLVAQLYDTNPGIQKLTIEILGRICDEPALLELVIATQPSVEHLGEAGQALMLKFLSLPSGFVFLNEEGYITDNLTLWFNELNYRYSQQLEVNLSHIFDVDSPSPGTPVTSHPSATSERAASDAEATCATKELVPTHFYAQLAQTPQGLSAIKKSGHFDTFVAFIRQYGLEDQDTVIISQLKSMLWAVGNLGTTEGGVSMIESHGLLGAITTIAGQSPVISVRGVTFFVLGFFARTQLGSQLLSSFGWESVHTQFLRFKGIAIPSNLCAIELEPWHPRSCINMELRRLRPPTGRVSRNILDALSMMGNSVLVSKASMRLGEFRTRYPLHFTCNTMRAYVQAYLRNLPWKQSVRRFVWELFDIRLDPDTLAGIESARSKIAIRDFESGTQQSQDESGNLTSMSRISPDFTTTGLEVSLQGEDRPNVDLFKRFACFDDSDEEEELAEDEEDTFASSSPRSELLDVDSERLDDKAENMADSKAAAKSEMKLLDTNLGSSSTTYFPPPLSSLPPASGLRKKKHHEERATKSPPLPPKRLVGGFN